MKSKRWIFILTFLTASLFGNTQVANAADDILTLPRFVVTADTMIFAMSWHCRWPTQKSKITRAWFTKIPRTGMAKKAGIENGDRLLQYDETTLADATGEWLAEKLKQAWLPGEVHTLLVERNSRKIRVTIEVRGHKTGH